MIPRSLVFILAVVPLSAEVMTVPDPEVDFPADRTVAWSLLFQATWDTVDQEMGKKPTRIDPPNAVMERLDRFQWKPETVLPDGAWKVWSGRATPEFVARANAEAEKMFGGKTIFEVKDQVLAPDPSQSSIACFGLLQREVEFVTPFHRSGKEPMLFGKKQLPVRFFGSLGKMSEGYGENVRVLAYRPVDRSFALEIACKGSDDKVILYRPAQRQSFSKACTWIRKWRAEYDAEAALKGSWEDRRLHRDDEIRIPYVSFESLAEMADQLQGTRYYENSPLPWTISQAKQKTKFELHEKGARVRVETLIQLDPFGDTTPEMIPRKFLFDRPFHIFLWRDKAEWPYLAVWVGDESALQVMRADP